jgi:hypothetical protein
LFAGPPIPSSSLSLSLLPTFLFVIPTAPLLHSSIPPLHLPLNSSSPFLLTD